MICLVVDGISTGSLLLDALHRRGARSLHVITAASRFVLEMRYTPPPDPEWVAAHLDFDDDLEVAVEWARRHGAERVVTGSEPGVELADRLSEALDLPGNGTVLSAARRDKDAMARTLAAAGVPTPVGLRTADADAAVAFWRERLESAPAVVKPLDSSGGDGVSFCGDEAEIRAAYQRALGARNLFGARNRELLIQREHVGRLFEVCTVSDAGRHEVVMLVETTKKNAVFDAMRLLTPSEVAERADVVDVGLRALDGLGIRYGAAHVEVLITADGPVVIEVAARLIGLLSPEHCRAALGVDQVERLVDVTLDPTAIGAPPPRPEAERFARSVPLCSDVAGRMGPGVAELEARLAALPSAWQVRFRSNPGDPLKITVDLPTSPGVVDLLHEDEAQVVADHQAIRDMERRGLWRLALA